VTITLTPPGLTCGRCEQPLTPDLAKVRDDTYVHASRCPCLIEGCDRTNHAKGYCNLHHLRLIKHGDPMHSGVIETEDVEWMVETGETFEGAAKRLGSTVKSLESVLRRRGRLDLIEALRRRTVAA
jgi:hypothetical protein